MTGGTHYTGKKITHEGFPYVNGLNRARGYVQENLEVSLVC